MPLQSKEVKVFCRDECDYFIKPVVIIKGGSKTKLGYTKYSEALIREAFEKQLQALLKK